MHAACRGRLDSRLGAGHGEERTANMSYMVVTLEVLKPSGWLNALVYCRESKEGHAMRGETQTGRPEVAADRGARSVHERPRLQIGDRARGGAHLKHVAHGRDAGGVDVQRLVEHRRAREHVAHVCDARGVEAQRLVEHRRALPNVERRAYGAGQGSGREVGGGGRPRRKQRAGEGSAVDWEQGTGRSAP